MKKILLFLAICLSISSLKSQLPSFTITNITGDTMITCLQPGIHLYASSSSSAVSNYSWVSANSTLTGSNVIIYIPGTYTVSAAGGGPNQIIGISAYTVAPTANINPLNQNITCIPASATNVTITSNMSSNITHQIFSPNGGAVTSYTQTMQFTPGTPGMYTHVVTNNINGCSTSSTFTVTTSQGFPTYSLVSPQNFSLGCNSQSVAMINIINAQTTPTPGGAISYTLIGPPTSSIISGSVLSTNSAYTLNVPGLWTAIVRDNTNQCDSKTSFSIIQNTLGASFNVSVPTQIMDCNTNHIVLQGSSSNPNVSYEWSFMGTPGSIQSNSIHVFTNSVVPTATIINVYTLTITDMVTACKSSSVIVIYQNLFKPNPGISSGGVTALSCITPSVVLTNISTSGIPNGAFPNSQPVIGYLWNGPAPQTSLSVSSAYTAAVAGTYSLIAKDLNNGCSSSTVITLSDNKIYPIVTTPSAPYDLCANPSVVLSPTISGANLTYTWSYPGTASVSGQNSAALTTNMAGIYGLQVKDGASGCVTGVQMTVGICVGIDDVSQNHTVFTMYPNPSNGSFSISSGNQNNARVVVYNALGMIIKQQALISEKEMIDIRHESAGIYIVQIYVGDDLAYSSKLIKQ
jgi:hypothetical protein